jgi:hypothetical protein
MIGVRFNSTDFAKTFKDITDFSEGFLHGAKLAKTELLEQIGKATREMLQDFIDSNARINPDMLHHVYEWYLTGSPNARLFDIKYSSSRGGLSIDATFSQSKSVKYGSKKPFYNKAVVMEKGIAITIVPRNAKVLAFEENGQTVFTKGPVVVENPGGAQVAGSFQKVFDQFFNSYYSQSFMRTSGLESRIGNTTTFVNGIRRGKMLGKQSGIEVGRNWLVGKDGTL